MDWYFSEMACMITLMKFAGPGYVYFTDWRLGGIVRVRKTDGGEMMIIRRGISHIMHVKSFNADTQIGEAHFLLIFALNMVCKVHLFKYSELIKYGCNITQWSKCIVFSPNRI